VSTVQLSKSFSISKPTKYLHVRGVAHNRMKVEGVEIAAFNPAETTADCFKFRNKIGLEVALEALREGSSKRGVTIDDLWRYAGINRVANVMRPYL